MESTEPRAVRHQGAHAAMAAEVRAGLTSDPKTLPCHLFYDAEGSRLYEQITDLPEYYLTRAEREIFLSHAPDIVDRIAKDASGPIRVIELGAGSASKTGVLLREVVRRQGRCLYVPVDISQTALVEAEERLRTDLPDVRVRALAMRHEEALRAMVDIPAPRVVLFIGSSVGNLVDREASALLARIRSTLSGETWLLLGTDLRKSPSVLLPAYDDAAGVTAAFNKNILTHINRELGGHFDLDRFRHVARWNDAASRVEMHLESLVAQEVVVSGLDLRVRFAAGETIHTESSAKYDAARVARIVSAGGFEIEATYHDADHRFALHLARGG